MSRFHNLRIAAVEPATRDAVVVTFECPPSAGDSFRYTQGQHLTLRAQIEGEEVRRSYSICAGAQEQTLRVAIKRVADGAFSNWAHENLKAGQSIDCMEPAGHFNVPLQPDAARHHVAFAAGSGITPVLSIIKTTLAAEPRGRFTLIYGNRASSSVLFKEELEDLKDRYLQRFNLVFVLSRELQDVELFNGRIDRAKCDRLLEQWVPAGGIDVAYICGPRSMMEEVSASLQAHGVEPARIRMELFDSGVPRGTRARATVPVKGRNEAQVTTIMDGRARGFAMTKNASTLLDAALEQGIELPYACKGGVCASCRCKLVKGEVDMDANYALEDYEVARGFILACQSFPVSDELVVDFDQDG